MRKSSRLGCLLGASWFHFGHRTRQDALVERGLARQVPAAHLQGKAQPHWVASNRYVRGEPFPKPKTVTRAHSRCASQMAIMPVEGNVPTVVRRKSAAEDVAPAVAAVEIGDVVESINGEKAASLARDAFIAKMQARPLELEFCRFGETSPRPPGSSQ